MLKSVKHICSLDIEATDGKIGKVDSLLFDDQNWTVRYLVADTGSWLPGRRVLLSPEAAGRPYDQQMILPVELSKEQVKNSPDLDVSRPVSREREMELHRYYGWTPYWMGGYGIISPVPPAMPEQAAEAVSVEVEHPHLRSTREVMHYHIHAQDGGIGHVADFIVDDKAWIIRYLVVDTRTWLPGRKVLVSPDWADTINWDESSVVLDLTREEVKASPEYDPHQLVNRETETRLYDYYGRPAYWA